MSTASWHKAWQSLTTQASPMLDFLAKDLQIPKLIEWAKLNLLSVSSIILISATACLFLSTKCRRNIADKLRLGRRQSSSAKTPPRSLSPDNKEAGYPGVTSAEYVTQFPPSQRGLLPSLISKMPRERQPDVPHIDLAGNQMKGSLLGWEDDYRQASPSKYVYSGFSVAQILALGDFPDYAHLSGIPLPSAYTNFNIDTALPRPYRPFRWPYHQTMSLTKLEPDWWLELEKSYRVRIAQRKALFAEHGEGVLKSLPGSELANKELMEMCLQFLCARYPQHFSLQASTDSPGKTVFRNEILGTAEIVQDRHPLLVLMDNVPEDFAIMIRNQYTGYYHFRSGMICSALGWNVASKIGKQLHEIHAPIPDYKEKMQFSMDRFFTKMPTYKPIQRGSWGLEVDQPLYMPPGDPHEKYRDYQCPDMTLDRIHLRVDWQTLRRLPLSGAIVFNFKGLFTPITEFRDEPGIPGLVLKICKEAKKNLMEYKNTWHTEHVALNTMELYQKEQEENGLISKNWQEETLEESPFYPGWQEKWRRQQGF